MSVVNMAKDIKKIYPTSIVCYKVGAFMQIFGKDAYIVSYLFGYSIKEVNSKESIASCGFPKNAINKVIAKLERNKLNYVIIDTRNNYDVESKSDNKNLNDYEEILQKAQRYIRCEKRLKQVVETLLDKVEKEDTIDKIRKIETIAYEN